MNVFLVSVIAAAVVLMGSLVLFTAWIAFRVEKALPPQGRFIEIDGTRIHYLDRGEGPVIVLIHGLGGQMRNFTHSLLERLTNEFRVILIDRPGSGYSIRSRETSAGLRTQGKLIANFIYALQLHQPLVVGHSLGGAVALATALDHSECVGGLVLISPLTHIEEAAPASFRRLAIRSRLVRWLAAWTLATPLAILKGNDVLAVVFSPDTPPQDFDTKGGGLLGLRPSSFYSASTDMVAVNDDLPGIVSRYSSLSMPVSILFGASDGILDHRSHGAALQSKVAGAELKLLSGRGHMLPITAPDETAEWIRAAAHKLAHNRANVSSGAAT
jgi:pimeloyl-ACP methyl ester carboxylesterase